DLNTTEKEGYMDEADHFYANPSVWIKRNMSRHIPPRSHSGHETRTPGVRTPNQPGKIETIPAEVLAKERAQHFWATREGRKPWPDYLVFFAQLEPTMQTALRGSAYGECKRLFNSHWHDDWRRAGD